MTAAQLIGLLLTAEAWAAGDGGHPGPAISDVIFPTLNFLIYAFIIVKYALPLVRSFLKTRREEVMATIAQASAKKSAAEALVRDYQGKLAGLDGAIRSLHGSLRDEGEREKARLLTEAATLAVKIKQDANFLADQELKMARQQLREELANQAEAGARTLVQANLTAADQQRLSEDFIHSIGQAR